MTFRQTAYAIQESFKKAYDDSDIQIPLILYYISVVANSINARELKQGRRSGKHLSVFTNVPVILHPELGLYYLDLPESIVNMNWDAGIEFITYNIESCCCLGPAWAQVSADPTTAGQLRSIYGDPVEKPSEKQPYYYYIGVEVNGVKGFRVFLAGPECINLRDVQVGLYSPVDPTPCDLDQPIGINDEFQEELIKTVIEMIRWVQLVPDMNVNDGADNQSIPQTPMPQVQPQAEAQSEE